MSHAQQEASQELVDNCRTFLRRYYDSRQNGGTGRLDQFLQSYPTETKSLVVDFGDLDQYQPTLAEDLLDNPDTILNALTRALRTYDVPADINLDQAKVRVGGLDRVFSDYTHEIGSYGANDDGKLLRLRGQVAKVAQSRGRLIEGAYECIRCGSRTRVPAGQQPHECRGCDRQGPFDLDWSASVKEDYQLVRLQRPPEKSVAGASTNTIDAELTEDLVGCINPGDRVSLAAQLEPELDDEDRGTFVMRANVRGVQHEQTDYEDLNIGEYEDEIKDIANSPNPLQRVIDSIKPSHQGDEDIKEAIALQMFGGVKKELPDGDVTRGRSHILLVGDPGLDKSGLLNYAKKLTPRSVYTSGKSATAAGLTCAAVQSDFGDGGWTLEAGALVQAHKGLCAIDEFDKMDEEDQSGVMEALSEGTISPSKAGITNVTLPAETTVLAAANPKHGRFDDYEPIGSQIDLDPALISRFDLIFTMSDSPDPDKDEHLADHLNDAAQVGQQVAAGQQPDTNALETVDPDIDPEVMRHYIAYARKHCSPVMNDAAKQRFKQFYVSVRSQGASGDSPVPVTARKIEALHRLGEAMARIRLSDEVTARDADRVIEIVRGCLEDVGVDPETGEMDADIVETGTSKAQRDRLEAIKSAVENLEYETENGAPEDEVVKQLVEGGYAAQRVRGGIDKLKEKGELYSNQTGFLRAV